MWNSTTVYVFTHYLVVGRKRMQENSPVREEVHQYSAPYCSAKWVTTFSLSSYSKSDCGIKSSTISTLQFMWGFNYMCAMFQYLQKLHNLTWRLLSYTFWGWEYYSVIAALIVKDPSTLIVPVQMYTTWLLVGQDCILPIYIYIIIYTCICALTYISTQMQDSQL